MSTLAGLAREREGELKGVKVVGPDGANGRKGEERAVCLPSWEEKKN